MDDFCYLHNALKRWYNAYAANLPPGGRLDYLEVFPESEGLYRTYSLRGIRSYQGMPHMFLERSSSVPMVSDTVERAIQSTEIQMEFAQALCDEADIYGTVDEERLMKLSKTFTNALKRKDVDGQIWLKAENGKLTYTFDYEPEDSGLDVSFHFAALANAYFGTDIAGYYYNTVVLLPAGTPIVKERYSEYDTKIDREIGEIDRLRIETIFTDIDDWVESLIERQILKI